MISTIYSQVGSGKNRERKGDNDKANVAKCSLLNVGEG